MSAVQKRQNFSIHMRKYHRKMQKNESNVCECSDLRDVLPDAIAATLPVPVFMAQPVPISKSENVATTAIDKLILNTAKSAVQQSSDGLWFNNYSRVYPFSPYHLPRLPYPLFPSVRSPPLP